MGVGKDYDFFTTAEEAKKLLKRLKNKGCAVEEYPGTIKNNYIIHTDDMEVEFSDGTCITTRKLERDYVVLKEVPVTSRNSSYHVILTNNAKKVAKIKKDF